MSEEILYYPNQNPTYVKPGNGNGNSLPPLERKAEQRGERYAELVDEVLAGQRPVLGGRGLGDKWLESQIRVLAKEGYLPEEAGAYYRKESKDRVLGFNPVPYHYIADRESLKQELAQKHIKHVRIAGDKLELLKSRHRIGFEKQIDSANTTIALPGDLYAMKEILYLFNQKVHGKMKDHPLVIENPVDANDRGFWDQMLRGLKILNHNGMHSKDPVSHREYVDFEALAHHYGIYVTEDRESTLAVAKRVTPKAPPHEHITVKAAIPDESVIFVATGTMKKYEEIKKICAANGLRVKVRSIYELVDTYVSPPEEGRTYEGNAAEKVKAAFDAWHQMSEHERVARLEHLGIIKSQAFILSEDSGFHFMEKGLANEDEFRHIRHVLNEESPFPGVETGPSTIGVDGIRGFMHKIQHIFARRDKPNDRVVKKCVMALAPLEQEQYGDTKMHMVASEVLGRITFTPQPPNGAIEIDNYLVPDAIPGARRNQTEAQLGEKFFTLHSPRALATKGIAMEMGVEMEPGKNVEDDFSKDYVTGVVVDDSSYASKHQAEKYERTAHENGFGVITAPSAIDRPDDLQKNILSKSDSVVFAFDPDKAKEDFWRNVFMFSSMIVGEQTHDKYKFRKSFYVVNEKGAFDYLEELVDHLHQQGTIAEDPATLVKFTDTLDEALDNLTEDRKAYRRFHLPAYAVKEEPYEKEGRSGTKDFNVAIFCSATNKNNRYLEETRDFTKALIDDDFGVVSGAGALSMMGMITDTAYDMRKTHGAEHFGSTTPNIMPGEGDARDKMTEFLMARSIYERMEYMIDKADGFAIMVGGMGTVQEFSLLALLKERALEANDPYARDKMQHKEIVIIDTPMDSHNRGFYSQLKGIIDKNDPTACRRLGIHFVKSQEEAMEIFNQSRIEKRLRAGDMTFDNEQGQYVKGGVTEEEQPKKDRALIDRVDRQSGSGGPHLQ
jgi:predicted Rossmann-fold nucleotide-binding protein